MSLFVSVLKGSVNSHFGIKKYVVKILIVIYRDLTNYCQKRLKSTANDLLAVWEFVYRFMPCYLGVEVWSLKKFDGVKIHNNTFHYFDEDTDTAMTACEALAHSCIELLSVLISSQLFSIISKLAIHSLTNVLFHYYMLSNEELRTWDCNALYFVSVP